jgi:hypothetical protein
MDATLKGWMNQLVQVSPYLSQDGAGDPTLGALIDLYCYSYGGGSRLVRNKSGEEVVCTRILGMDGSALVHLKDFVYLDGRRFPIMSIVPYYDDVGSIDFVEVLL